MYKNRLHVVFHCGKWAYRREGAERVSEMFDTQAAAIFAAKNVARVELGAVYVHGLDGKIRLEVNYGHDPCPPPDRT